MAVIGEKMNSDLAKKISKNKLKATKKTSKNKEKTAKKAVKAQVKIAKAKQGRPTPIYEPGETMTPMGGVGKQY